MTKHIDWSSKTDESLAYAACCIWEELVNSPDGPWRPWREHSGASLLREVAVQLAVPAERLWCEITDDPNMGFDWEWIPMWLRTSVDWSDLNDWPKVLT